MTYGSMRLAYLRRRLHDFTVTRKRESAIISGSMALDPADPALRFITTGASSIGGTMACTIIIAKVVGCTLPLAAEKAGLDPAIMATPLISTLVDISTISVYFAIVSAVFAL